MSLRDFLEKKEKQTIEREIEPYLEAAKVLSQDDEKITVFNKLRGSSYRVVGNVCAKREHFADAIGVEKEDLLKRISHAIDNPSTPRTTDNAPCQQVIEETVDLTKIPIPTYTSMDMGPYITSGVFIAKDAEYGVNASFHRASPIDSTHLVARICERNLHTYFNRCEEDLEIAICLGLDPSILLSAAIPVDITVSELDVANTLKPFDVCRCKTKDLMVPAQSEIVLEGRITKELIDEGPFLDITRTPDIIRPGHVIEIDCITHREDAIFQALLPASKEHELLMGMPREPAIFNEVNKVCSCKNVVLSHGGCSWLHGVVQLDNKVAGDGKKAIDAAFKAHPSMKHVVIVDDDINIYDPHDVEWAIATRFQAGDDMIMRHEKGSSLDPSSREDRTTYKLGIDATIPSGNTKEKFKRINVGE